VNKHEVNPFCEYCVALAAVLFTNLIENLQLSSFAEAGIDLNLLIAFEQK